MPGRLGGLARWERIIDLHESPPRPLATHAGFFVGIRVSGDDSEKELLVQSV